MLQGFVLGRMRNHCVESYADLAHARGLARLKADAAILHYEMNSLIVVVVAEVVTADRFLQRHVVCLVV